MKLVPLKEDASRWENYFKNMSKGMSRMKNDITSYIIDQKGKGVVKEVPHSGPSMYATEHDPATGEIITPVSSALNQMKERTGVGNKRKIEEILDPEEEPIKKLKIDGKTTKSKLQSGNGKTIKRTKSKQRVAKKKRGKKQSKRVAKRKNSTKKKSRKTTNRKRKTTKSARKKNSKKTQISKTRNRRKKKKNSRKNNPKKTQIRKKNIRRRKGKTTKRKTAGRKKTKRNTKRVLKSPFTRDIFS